MSDRDPRTNPKAGDVLRGPKTVRKCNWILDYEHLSFTSWSLQAYQKPGCQGTVYGVPVEAWRKWAKNAEVIHAAE